MEMGCSCDLVEITLKVGRFFFCKMNEKLKKVNGVLKQIKGGY